MSSFGNVTHFLWCLNLDPPYVEVPEKLDDIIRLLKTEKFANHIGLKASLESAMHKRSPKNAYVLLIGFSGAGKSTTVILFVSHDTLIAACYIGGVRHPKLTNYTYQLNYIHKD